MSNRESSKNATLIVVMTVVTVILLTPVLGFGPLVALAAAYLASAKIRQMFPSN